MTISDEPDEDADNLDDDDLLEGVFRPGCQAPATKADAATELPDWPSFGIARRSLGLDPVTIQWFQDHHVDWFGQMQAVLRAWVEGQQDDAEPRG